MNALIDTNVIIDVLIRREPFFADSAKVLDRAARGDFTAWICATTVTTVFYHIRRQLGTSAARKKIAELVAVCATAAVNHAVIDAALRSPFTDFEDAVPNHAALTAGANCIVTRNGSDFRHSTLIVDTPTQFLASIS